MGLFSKLASAFSNKDPHEKLLEQRVAREPKPYRHDWRDYPHKAEVLRLVQDLDAAGLVQMYQQQRSLEERWRLLHSFMDDALSEVPEATVLTLIQRLQQDPHPVSVLLQGSAYFELSWLYHDDDDDDSDCNCPVNPDNQKQFYALSDQGHALCYQAAESLGSSDIVGYLMAQKTLLDVSTEHAQAIHQAWHQLDPWNYIGLDALAFRLDQRWSGSPEASLELALDVLKNAPDGHPSLGVIATVVWNRWIFLETFEDLEYDECDEQTVDHPRIMKMLRMAYKKMYLNGSTPEPYLFAQEDLNTFAWLFYFGDVDVDELGYHAMMQLKGAVYEGVWEERDGEVMQDYIDARDYFIEAIEFDADE